jgi:hypothetical protein
MRRAIAAAVLAIAVIALVGCSGGGEPVAPVTSPLVGTWRAGSIAVDSEPQELYWNEVVVINSDGSFRMDSDEGETPHTVSGSISASNGIFTARITESYDASQVGTTRTGTYSITAGCLTLTTNSGGHERAVEFYSLGDADWTASSSLAGRWVLASEATNGVASAPASVLLQVGADGASMRWEGRTDNGVKGRMLTKGDKFRFQCTEIVTAQEPGTVSEGTYSLRGNQLVLTIPEDSGTKVETYEKLQPTTTSVAGEYLTVYAENDGEPGLRGIRVVTLGADGTFSIVDRSSRLEGASGTLECSYAGHLVLQYRCCEAEARKEGSFETMSYTQDSNLLKCTLLSDPADCLWLAKRAGNASRDARGTWLCVSVTTPYTFVEQVGDSGMSLVVDASSLRMTMWDPWAPKGTTLDADVTVYGDYYWLLHRTAGEWSFMGPRASYPAKVGSEWRVYAVDARSRTGDLRLSTFPGHKDPLDTYLTFTRYDSHLPADLVGTWALQSWTLDGAPQTVTPDTLQINSGGTYSHSTADAYESGTVAIFGGKAGQTLVTSCSDPKGIGRLNGFFYTLSGNQLTLRMNREFEGDVVQVFSR